MFGHLLPLQLCKSIVAALTASLSHGSTVLASASWTGGCRQCRTSRDLDHEVRVDLILGSTLAVPGHHVPPILSLGGLVARRTASSAHRVSTSYKCAQRVHASAPLIEAPGVENGTPAWPRCQATPACRHTSAGGRPWPPGLALLYSSADQAGLWNFVLQNVTI